MLSENALIASLRQRFGSNLPSNIVGIGDDCCLWQSSAQQALSVDAIVEGVHFLSSDPEESIGVKAAGAALSDLAAMGAKPIGAAICLQISDHRDPVRLMESFGKTLQKYGCPLLGGDTVRSPVLALAVTVWGECPVGGRLIKRTGGQVGDLLCVSGPLGGSFHSGRHLRPIPRLELGQRLGRHAGVHAMMDLSDGLAADAPRLAQASICGVLLHTRNVPIHPDAAKGSDPLRAALEDGEDFELLVAISPSALADLADVLSPVGQLVEECGSWIEDDKGIRLSPYRGFEHISA